MNGRAVRKAKFMGTVFPMNEAEGGKRRNSNSYRKLQGGWVQRKKNKPEEDVRPGNRDPTSHAGKKIFGELTRPIDKTEGHP